MEQLHLDTKQHREVDFKPWHPNSELSVVEFLQKFESWSRGRLSQSEQAHVLYSKHIDRSVVQGNRDLEERKSSYPAMRDWLIQKWGRASIMGDLYLSNILKLGSPNKSGGQGAMIDYLKGIYTNMITVSTLELSKGRRIPGLADYITTNRWLKDIYLSLPRHLQKRFMYRLEDSGERLSEIEGMHYFRIIMNMVRSSYESLEEELKLPQRASSSKSSASLPQTAQSGNPPAVKKPPKISAHATQVQQPQQAPPSQVQQSQQGTSNQVLSRS